MHHDRIGGCISSNDVALKIYDASVIAVVIVKTIDIDLAGCRDTRRRALRHAKSSQRDIARRRRNVVISKDQRAIAGRNIDGCRSDITGERHTSRMAHALHSQAATDVKAAQRVDLIGRRSDRN